MVGLEGSLEPPTAFALGWLPPPDQAVQGPVHGMERCQGRDTHSFSSAALRKRMQTPGKQNTGAQNFRVSDIQKCLHWTGFALFFV